MILLLLGIICLLFFVSPIFINRYKFSTADMLAEELGFWTLIGQSLRKGKFPLWDDHYYYEFHCVMFNSLFYPPTLILAYLTSFIKLDWRMYVLELNTIFHVFLSSVFMYLFLSQGMNLYPWPALFGAIVFTYSEFVILHSNIMSKIQSICWLPLIFLFILKSNPIGAGIALAMMCLGGMPVILAITAVLMALLALFRWQVSTTTLLAGIVALGLSAVQIWPSYAYFKNSIRNIQTYKSITELGSYPPKYFLNMIFNQFIKDPAYYFMPIYCGVIPVIACLCSWQPAPFKGFFVFSLFFSALMMAGKYTPFAKLMYLIKLPLYRIVGYWGLIFTFSIACLSAMAVSHIPNVLIGALLVLVIIDYFNANNTSKFPSQSPQKPSVLFNKEAINFPSGEYRVSGLPWPYYSGAILGVDTLGYLGGSQNLRFGQFRGENNFWGSGGHNWFELRPDSQWVDFFNIKYLISVQPLSARGEINPHYILIGANLWENTRVMPRKFVVDNYAIGDLKTMEQVDLSKTVILEEKSISPYFLVSSTPYSKGWKAYAEEQGMTGISCIALPLQAFIKKERLKILRANHCFMAVELPDKDMKVDWIYDPIEFKIGLGITIFTIIVLVIWGIL